MSAELIAICGAGREIGPWRAGRSKSGREGGLAVAKSGLFPQPVGGARWQSFRITRWRVEDRFCLPRILSESPAIYRLELENYYVSSNMIRG